MDGQWLFINISRYTVSKKTACCEYTQTPVWWPQINPQKTVTLSSWYLPFGWNHRSDHKSETCLIACTGLLQKGEVIGILRVFLSRSDCCGRTQILKKKHLIFGVFPTSFWSRFLQVKPIHITYSIIFLQTSLVAQYFFIWSSWINTRVFLVLFTWFWVMKIYEEYFTSTSKVSLQKKRPGLPRSEVTYLEWILPFLSKRSEFKSWGIETYLDRVTGLPKQLRHEGL